jgi:hypothetical protein
MALTAVVQQVIRGLGGEDYRVVKATGDASYPTGGYAVTPALFGFNAFATDGLGTGLPPTLGFYDVFSDLVTTPYSIINPANGNLQLIVTATNVEVANGVSETGYTVLLGAWGH